MIMIVNVRMSVAVKCELNGNLSLFLLSQDNFRFVDSTRFREHLL